MDATTPAHTTYRGNHAPRQEAVYRTPHLELTDDPVTFPDGVQGHQATVRNRDGVGVIVLRTEPDETHSVLLQQEYRYPVDRVFNQLPGGGIDEGEEPVDAAYRELEEETGLHARTMAAAGSFHVAPALLTGRSFIFVATADGVPVDDPETGARSDWVPLADLHDRLLEPGILAGTTLAALALAAMQGLLPPE